MGGRRIIIAVPKGKADTFGDIDIMAAETDAGRIKEILQQYGELAAPNPNVLYKTRHFYEFTIDGGVEIDVMAGFTIVSGGAEEHDCSLHPGSINEHLCINGVAIPVQSLDDWRTYYALMGGRMEKVAMIDGENRASFAPLDECD